MTSKKIVAWAVVDGNGSHKAFDWYKSAVEYKKEGEACYLIDKPIRIVKLQEVKKKKRKTKRRKYV